MTEDKVMQKIHQNQARLRQKKMSWDEEVKYMSKRVKKLAKKYGFHICPATKSPYYGQFLKF